MGVKSLISVFLIALLISSLSVASIARLGSAQSPVSFKISGYVLDSSGHGIGGAMIIFGVPLIVPSVYSDSSGYYVVSAPAGTYHVNVWPAADSNFIYYDQSGFLVSSDITKNITLFSGCKVSGYIFDSSGKPVPKAVIALDSYLCGWYSDYSGRYFVTAPPGTYTLSARPGTGPKDAPGFSTYYESNFVLNGNVAKNITLSTTIISNTATPSANASSFEVSGYILDGNGRGIGGANIIFNLPSTVPSVYSDSSGHYVVSAPAGTYHVNVWPPYNSNHINYDEPGFEVKSDTTKNITLHSGYKVSGYISDSSGKPVTGAVVLLDNFGSGWFSNSAGYYFLSVPAGTYTIDAHPRTGYNYSGPTTVFPTYYEQNFTVSGTTFKNITVGLSPSVTLSKQNSSTSPSDSKFPSPSPSKTKPEKDKEPDLPTQPVSDAFSISSNSTITSLEFNSKNQKLRFSVNGPPGTTGFAKVKLAKSLVSQPEKVKVHLDGKELEYQTTSDLDSLLLSFNYTHSTHRVSIDLSESVGGATAFHSVLWTWIIAAIGIVTFSASLLLCSKKPVTQAAFAVENQAGQPIRNSE